MVRFSSRKFLLTVGTVAPLLAAKQYAEAAGVAVAYLLSQGGIDVATTVKEVRKGASAAEDAAD